MTPHEADGQALYLAAQAREHGSVWLRTAGQLHPGERFVRTCYSTYRVVDGRCLGVQRADRAAFGQLRDDEKHECLGLHLVGYLTRHEEPNRVRWTLHVTPRPESKAVFWRPSKSSGTGQFVVTSRLAPRVVPPALPAVLRATPAPPPWPRPELVGTLPLAASTPTGGVQVPSRVRPPPLPASARRVESPPRAPEPRRGGTRVMKLPAPPPRSKSPSSIKA